MAATSATTRPGRLGHPMRRETTTAPTLRPVPLFFICGRRSLPENDYSLRDLLDQVDGAAAIAPFVVVPAHDLEHVVADHLGPVGRRRSSCAGSPMMSLETIGSSVYSRMPFSGPSAASFMAALTASFGHRLGHLARSGRRRCRSATGTRSEMPVSLPFSAGNHQADGLRGAGAWSG